MNYNETIEYLFNRLPAFQRIGGAAYKEGLDNSIALDKLFGSPHKKYKTIHVGGTNGKGSCSHLIAAILEKSGYKVGLYTSPHLLDFRERIRVNGKMIEEQYVIDFVKKYHSTYESISPSFFELTMMMAFKYFADQNVDVSVIEVGLGGRLDSTNIIRPDICVITNIGYDHMQFLGNTLEKIAFEKAGIIKRGIPVVIGETTENTRNVFQEKADNEGAPIIFAEGSNLIISYQKLKEGGWLYQTASYPNLLGELDGYAQPHNALTVLCAIDQLKNIGYNITSEGVYNGFENVQELTGLMGRWQTVSQKPRTIVDTGHNSHGIKYVVEQLDSEVYEELHFILAVVNDKDLTPILQLLPKNAHYYFTQAAIHRALDAAKLYEQATSMGLRGEVCTSISKAIEKANIQAEPNDLIFIGGSNFTVAEALEYYKEKGI